MMAPMKADDLIGCGCDLPVATAGNRAAPRRSTSRQEALAPRAFDFAL
jgi:hypothetical protein